MPLAAKTPPRLITLILATALAILTLNMFLPSLANIANEFDISYAMASLSLAGYLGVTVITQLLLGPLSDRYGRRPLMLTGLAIFSLASVGCALAPTFELFLFCRLLQSVMIVGQVISLATIRDTTSEGEAASRIGLVSMSMAVAPMLGPMLGGLLDEAFGWRANFYFYALAGFAMLLVVWFDMGETNKTPSPNMWSQFKTYPEVLKSRRFWGFAFTSTFSIGAFYVFITGAPLVAASVLDLSAAELGFGIGIITGGFMVGSFVTGRIARRHKLTSMMLTGRCFAVLGLSIGLFFHLTGTANIYTLFGSVILVGFGNGLTLPNSHSGVMSVRPKLAGSAAGLSGAMTVGLGAIVTSVTGVVISPENGPVMLFTLMLSCVLIALAATLSVIAVDRKEGEIRPKARS